jgi:hypothetical protein
MMRLKASLIIMMRLETPYASMNVKKISVMFANESCLEGISTIKKLWIDAKDS